MEYRNVFTFSENIDLFLLFYYRFSSMPYPSLSHNACNML